MKSYTELRMEKEAAERKLRLAQRQLKLVVHEHSKLLEKHRLMASTKDTLLEELKTVRSAANIMERDLKEQVFLLSFPATFYLFQQILAHPYIWKKAVKYWLCGRWTR